MKNFWVVVFTDIAQAPKTMSDTEKMCIKYLFNVRVFYTNTFEILSKKKTKNKSNLKRKKTSKR